MTRALFFSRLVPFGAGISLKSQRESPTAPPGAAAALTPESPCHGCRVPGLVSCRSGGGRAGGMTSEAFSHGALQR